jgi:hypothetical protein
MPSLACGIRLAMMRAFFAGTSGSSRPDGFSRRPDRIVVHERA